MYATSITLDLATQFRRAELLREAEHERLADRARTRREATAAASDRFASVGHLLASLTRRRAVQSPAYR